VIQLIMVGILIAFPELVLWALGDLTPVDLDKVRIDIPESPVYELDPSRDLQPPEPSTGAEPDAAKSGPVDDPNEAILRSLGIDAKK
jgi:hypothetical protein